MKYVLDASAALKWVLPEKDTDKAVRLEEDFENGVHELLAPDTFPVEIAHALTRAERRGILQPADGVNRFAWLLAALPVLHPSLALLPRAVELSSQFRIGVYDCLYVALAEREQCRLVTADDRLVKSMSGFSVVSLSSL